MQPIPEHPKRDYIFCLSTAFGDAYLFQAPCQVSKTFLIYTVFSGRVGKLILFKASTFTAAFKLFMGNIKFSFCAKNTLPHVYFYPTRRCYFYALLQNSIHNSQVELENWVNSIHSACAAAFARHRGKTGTLHLLQEEIFRLDKAIESVRKRSDLALKLQRIIEGVGWRKIKTYFSAPPPAFCPIFLLSGEHLIKSIYELIPRIINLSTWQIYSRVWSPTRIRVIKFNNRLRHGRRTWSDYIASSSVCGATWHRCNAVNSRIRK